METEYDELVFRARVLASLSRIDVFVCLGDLGAYPSDIASTLALAPSTVSHHLRVLQEAGLVHHVRQGRHRLYSTTGESWGVVSEAEIREMMRQVSSP